MKTVLLGCDYEALAELRTLLLAEGIDVRNVLMPHQFFRQLPEFSAMPVIVQWPLRDLSGASVVRRIRELFRDATPIVVVGTRDDPGDTVAALKSGADDFVASDSPPDVLVARIRAVLRRYQVDCTDQRCVRFGEYDVDYGSQSVTLRGDQIVLTPKEFDLFWVFVTNRERLLPKAELMACVWGQSSDLDTHTLAQHVHALRRKLRLESNGLRLASVYGAGYRFERCAANSTQQWAA